MAGIFDELEKTKRAGFSSSELKELHKHFDNAPTNFAQERSDYLTAPSAEQLAQLKAQKEAEDWGIVDYPIQWAKGIGEQGLGVASGILNAFNALDSSNTLGNLADTVDNFSKANLAKTKQYSPADLMPFSSDYYTNPQGATRDAIGMLGSWGALRAAQPVLGSILGGVANAIVPNSTMAMAGAKAVAENKAGGIAASLPFIGAWLASNPATMAEEQAKWLGNLTKVISEGMTSSKLSELVSEGGSAAGEVRQKGGDQAAQADAFAKTVVAEMPMLAITDKIEAVNFFKGLGTKGSKAFLTGLAKNMAVNGYEEIMQNRAQKFGTGEGDFSDMFNPTTWDDEDIMSGVAGALGAGLMHSGAKMLSRNVEDEQEAGIDGDAGGTIEEVEDVRSNDILALPGSQPLLLNRGPQEERQQKHDELMAEIAALGGIEDNTKTTQYDFGVQEQSPADALEHGFAGSNASAVPTIDGAKAFDNKIKTNMMRKRAKFANGLRPDVAVENEQTIPGSLYQMARSPREMANATNFRLQNGNALTDRSVRNLLLEDDDQQDVAAAQQARAAQEEAKRQGVIRAIAEQQRANSEQQDDLLRAGQQPFMPNAAYNPDYRSAYNPNSRRALAAQNNVQMQQQPSVTPTPVNQQALKQRDFAEYVAGLRNKVTNGSVRTNAQMIGGEADNTVNGVNLLPAPGAPVQRITQAKGAQANLRKPSEQVLDVIKNGLTEEAQQRATLHNIIKDVYKNDPANPLKESRRQLNGYRALYHQMLRPVIEHMQKGGRKAKWLKKYMAENGGKMPNKKKLYKIAEDVVNGNDKYGVGYKASEDLQAKVNMLSRGIAALETLEQNLKENPTYGKEKAERAIAEEAERNTRKTGDTEGNKAEEEHNTESDKDEVEAIELPEGIKINATFGNHNETTQKKEAYFKFSGGKLNQEFKDKLKSAGFVWRIGVKAWVADDTPAIRKLGYKLTDQMNAREQGTEKAENKKAPALAEGYTTESGRSLDEADEQEYVLHKGEKNFGEIDKVISDITNGELSPGYIRLKVGNKSKGLIHTKEHENQAIKAGYNSIEDMIFDVCRNFTQIYKKEPKIEGYRPTYILVKQDNKDTLNATSPVYFELQSDGKNGYYIVITAIPKNNKSLQKEIKKETLVYSRQGVDSATTSNGSTVSRQGNNNVGVAQGVLPTSDTTSVPAISVASSDNDVKETIPTKGESAGKKIVAKSGKTATVITDSGRELKVTYKLVPTGRVVTSHTAGSLAINKSYPQELQPRDRQRAAMQLQISKMANNLRPADLVQGRNLNQGAPIVRTDGVVLNGNGRAIAIQTAQNSKNESAANYKKYLVEHAEEFGFKAEDVKGMTAPMLVRMVDDLDEASTQDIINSTTGGSRLGASEQAKVDAGKISLSVLERYVPNDNGDLQTAANREFLRGILNNILSDNDMNAYLDEQGGINADGLQRIKRALFQAAYGNDELIAKMAEDTDDEIKNITNALTTAAPIVARVNAKMAQGKLNEYDLAKTIADTVSRYNSLRKNNEPIEHYLSQQSMFSDYEIAPEVAEMLKVLDEYKRKSRKLAQYFNRMCEIIEKQGDPNQGALFDGAEPLSLREIIQAANREENSLFNKGESATSEIAANTEVSASTEEKNDGKSDAQKPITAKTFFENPDALINHSVVDKMDTGTKQFINAMFENGKSDSGKGTKKTTQKVEQPVQEDTSEEQKPTKRFNKERANKTLANIFGKKDNVREPKPSDVAPKFVNVFDESKAEELIKKIKNKLNRLSANPMFDPELMSDIFQLGGIYVQQGVNKFANWSKLMVGALGEKVRPFLTSAWNSLNKFPKEQELNAEAMQAVMERVGSDFDEGKSLQQIKKDLVEEFGDEVAGYVDAAYEGVKAYPTSDNADNMVQSKQDNTEGGSKNGNNTSRTGSISEGGQSDEVQGAEDSGQVGRVPGQSDEQHERQVQRSENEPAEERPSTAGSNGAGSVSAHSGQGEDSAGTAGRGTVPLTPAQKADAKPSETPGHNHTITKDRLGDGNKKTKYKNNVKAIKLLKQLEAEGRQATPTEQEILANYVGWGGLSSVFDINRRGEAWDDNWAKEAKELKELLTDEEYKAARASTTTAFYTPVSVIKNIYSALERLGFKSGKVLEPSMGTGNFFGVMPESMRCKSSLNGVEFDSLTGRIAKQLYQKANIEITGFEYAQFPDGYFDLAISNVPFDNSKQPYDPKYNKYGFNIHNYFFAKAMDKVRPGGLVCFVTSTATMQGSGDSAKLRALLKGKADFVGAIRLPNTTFKDNANTEVTSDVIILQKRKDGAMASDFAQDWLETVPSGVHDKYNRDLDINEYFKNHPEMVLGELKAGGQYGSLIADGEGVNIDKAMQKAIKTLPAGIYEARTSKRNADSTKSAQTFLAPNNSREGTLIEKDGKVYHVEQSQMVELPKAVQEKATSYVGLRDVVKKLLAEQINPATSDEQLSKTRAELNKLYDNFVKKYGPVNDPKNIKQLSIDPDYGILEAIEEYKVDPLTNKATVTKRAIFDRRTVNPKIEINHADNVNDALTLSLTQKNGVDLEFMSKVMDGKDKESIIKELGDRVFENPLTSQFELAEEYLSGNVREKLEHAQFQAKTQPRFNRNVEALKKVQPKDLAPEDISVNLGAPWIPPKDIQAFTGHLLGSSYLTMDVAYVPSIGQWQVNWGSAQTAKRSVAVNQTWGTRHKSMKDLLEAALNQSTPTVTYVDENKKTHVDSKATMVAQSKLREIQEEFKKWIWTDKKRADRLTAYYNRNFNNWVLRQYDGGMLNFPGYSTVEPQLKQHQKDVVWRILQDGTCLMAHCVGAGKTWSMQTAAMELKRLGLANKSMFVIPNHMLQQFENEFRRIYPNAKLLTISSDTLPDVNVAGSAKLSKTELNKRRAAKNAKRQSILGKIATEDWDGIIISHNIFKRIPMSPESYNRFYEQQIEEVTNAITELKAAEENGSTRITVKALEKTKTRLESKLKKDINEEAKDIVIPFEQLGIDQIFVDEADQFKNLYFTTKMRNINGMSQANSQRSMDIFMKTQYLINSNNGRGVVFATGTPISNTMAEMFTMLRYLDNQGLKEKNLGFFDNWAATFATRETTTELAPDGSGYRAVEKFTRFNNMPELVKMFRKVADVKKIEDLDIKIPKLKNGKPTVVEIPMNSALEKYIKETAQKRAKAIHNKMVDPSEDNMLKLTGDLRKASLDMRLIDPTIPDSVAGGKVKAVAENVANKYKETDSVKGVQLVFCDLSTPKGASDKVNESDSTETKEEAEDNNNITVYAEIKKALIKKGIPANQIAFIHDAKTKVQKEQLFERCRQGQIRVLIGSTEKMGAGTNIQKKLVALHHVDAPWRPRDIEQREGRILRQGNDNEEVEIFNYVTKGSFDANMWEKLKNKATMIGQAMSGNLTQRSLEDADATVLNFAEVEALATGNPLMAERVMVTAKLTQMEALAESYRRDQEKNKRMLSLLPNGIKVAEEMKAKAEADIKTRKNISGDNFSMVIGKSMTVYTERAKAKAELERIASNYNNELGGVVAKAGGFDIRFRTIPAGALFTSNDGTTAYKANESTVRAEIVGEGTYYCDPTQGSIEYAIMHAPDKTLESANKTINDNKQLIKQLEAKLKEPFQYEEQYEALKKRATEIEAELNKNNEQADNDNDTISVDVEDSEAQMQESEYTPKDSVTVEGNATSRITVSAKPYRRTDTQQLVPYAELNEKVSKEEYNKINSAAKKYGGFYSRYAKGFIFKTNEDRDNFINAINGNKYSISSEARQRTLEEVTAEVKKALPGAEVEQVGDNKYIATMANGKKFGIVIHEDGIQLNNEQSQEAGKAHNKNASEAEGYWSAWESIDGEAVDGVLHVSAKSRKGTAFHETLHAAMDLCLTDKEKAALYKHFKKKAQESGRDVDEEIADAYKEWVLARQRGEGTMFGKLFRKVKDFLNKLQSLFFGKDNVGNIFRKLESGEAWKQRGNVANDNNRSFFSLLPKTIQQELKARGEAFRQAVEDVKNGIRHGNEVYEVCDTPLLLQKLGVGDFPIKMSLGVAYNNTKPKNTGAKHAHGVPFEVFGQIPRAIQDPVFVIESATVPGDIVVYTDIKIGEESVLLPIKISKQSGGDKTNYIKTIYPRTNEAGFITKQALEGRLLYVNSKKSSTWLGRSRVQFPQSITKSSSLLESSVSKELEKVNKNSAKVHYSVAPDEHRIADTFTNTERKGVIDSVKDFFKEHKKSLYTDWIDKNNPLKGFDALTESFGGLSVYDQVQSLPATTAGMLKAICEGDVHMIKAANQHLKKVKMKHNVTLAMALKLITKKEIDKKYNRYLKENGFDSWVNAFGAYLGVERCLEMAELAKAEGKVYKFPKGLTESECREFSKNVPQEFRAAADIFYKVNDNIISVMEDAEVFSPELAKALRTKYKKYCPLLRDFSDTAAADNFIGGLTEGGRGIGNVSIPLKKINIEGSERGLLNPLETILKSYAVMLNRAERNKVGLMAVRNAELADMSELIEAVPEKKDKDGNVVNAVADPKNCIFTVLVNGKKKAFKTTQDLYGPIVGYNLPTAGLCFNVARMTARMLRTGATISPSFIIRNFLRDTVFAGVASKNGFIPLVDSIRGAMALYNDPALRAEFTAAGVTEFNFYSSQKSRIKSLDAMAGEKPTGAWEMMKWLFSQMEAASDFVESSTRMGEFMRAKENGLTMEEAARAAREITLDFSRSGRLGEQYNQIVPFFNACLQGGDKMVRLFREDPQGTSLKIFKYIILPSLLLYAMNWDKDWYKDLDPDIKNNYWCFGEHLRIPKPQEAGVLFGSGIEALFEQARGKDKDAVENWLKAFASNMIPGVVPTLFLPLLEWQANYSYFKGKQLVGSKYQRLPDELQYGDYTSELSKAIGNNPVKKLSPMKIDNLVRGYTGTMGALLWSAPDVAMNKNADMPSKHLYEYAPFRDFTVTDANESRPVNEFYAILDKANKQHAGFGVKGKPEAAVQGLRKTGTMLSNIRKDIDKITHSKLKPERKRELIDRRKEKMKQLAKQANEKYGRYFE